MCLAQARTESIYYVCVSLAMFVCRVAIMTVAVAGLGWGIWGVLGASIATCRCFGVILNLREFWNTAFRPDMHKNARGGPFRLAFRAGWTVFLRARLRRPVLSGQVGGAGELGIYALGCKLATAVGIFSFTPLFKVWSARMYDAFAMPKAAAVVGRACTPDVGRLRAGGNGTVHFRRRRRGRSGFTAIRQGNCASWPRWCWRPSFECRNNLMDGVFYAYRKTGLKPWIAFVAMLVMFGLFAWLIPQFGAMGAACAILGGNCFLRRRRGRFRNGYSASITNTAAWREC